MRILMVCLGNICRSPMAEAILRHKAREAGLLWTIDSAGTESYHVGEPPHQLTTKVCQAHGIDISDMRARRFTQQDFEQYDKIYAMADDVYTEIRYIGGKFAPMEKVDFFLNELKPGSNGSVPDPWYGGEEEFMQVFRIIDATCDAIIEKYK